ncbi:tubulin-like protein CetZ [Lachnospiraceae bacterium]|jgi:Cell division GTPase|nr:tubulin-like protein CetZ [Lachnospiraceae bacterium]GFI70585.1 tubulin-like protein CetZ [Lachnospiraceae bacterium]
MNENKNVMRKRSINDRLKITVIGCGACGNGICAEIQKDVFALEGNKSNVSFIGINTSTEDLATVDLDHKIHLNNSKGAACNRENGVQDLAESIEIILPELQSYIIEDSIVFIATSLGGGTGSAITPHLASILLGLGFRVGIIAVLPSDNESLKIKDNSRQTFNEIEGLKPQLGSIFILDNNSADKQQINRTFASLFTSVMCINNKSQDGNMDLAEIEACLTTPSFSIITKVSRKNGNTAKIVEILNDNNNIFAKRDDKVVSVIGISEAVSAKESNIDMTGLRKEIGIAPTEFHGYLSASEENVIILSGLTMPYGRLDTMAESVDSEADIIQNAMKATTQVRTANVSDVFRKPVIDTTTQTTNEPKMLGMAALADLKARRISK